jgi:hypothetical protein
MGLLDLRRFEVDQRARGLRKTFSQGARPMLGGMEADGKTYLVPHPLFARVIMTVAGAFALVITPYELWRGVWPLNATSPFFGVILAGGMTVGAAFVYGGMFAAGTRMVFSPGRLRVHSANVFGQWERVYLAQDIEGFTVEERETSDGPNDWYAVMTVRGGVKLPSRPLGTRAAAETALAEFKAALGVGGGAG